MHKHFYKYFYLLLSMNNFFRHLIEEKKTWRKSKKKFVFNKSFILFTNEVYTTIRLIWLFRSCTLQKAIRGKMEGGWNNDRLNQNSQPTIGDFCRSSRKIIPSTDTFLCYKFRIFNFEIFMREWTETLRVELKQAKHLLAEFSALWPPVTTCKN